MSRPLVSIIIPAYNCADFISKTIQSVLSQSYQNFEILICNDCSTDNTLEIINNLTYADSRITIFENENNIGKVLTVNRMLKIAKGDFITILDADDYFSSDKILKQVEFLENNLEYGLCGCNYASVNISGKVFSVSNYPLTDRGIRDYIRDHDLKDFPFCCATALIRKSAINQVGGYRDFFIDCCIGEDIDLILRIMEQFKVANIPLVGYYYRFHSTSLTRKVYFSIKDRHMHDIVSYMAKQRQNKGSDFLQNNDWGDYNELIEHLGNPYRNDKGLLYRKVVIEYAINKDKRSAKMYYRRLLKISGLNLKTIKIWCIMQGLLAFNYDILLRLKKIIGISHLSSKA